MILFNMYGSKIKPKSSLLSEIEKLKLYEFIFARNNEKFLVYID